jgi:hypothetical protein
MKLVCALYQHNTKLIFNTVHFYVFKVCVENFQNRESSMSYAYSIAMHCVCLQAGRPKWVCAQDPKHRINYAWPNHWLDLSCDISLVLWLAGPYHVISVTDLAIGLTSSWDVSLVLWLAGPRHVMSITDLLTVAGPIMWCQWLSYCSVCDWPWLHVICDWPFPLCYM